MTLRKDKVVVILMLRIIKIVVQMRSQQDSHQVSGTHTGRGVS
jgi:hypothetical protein